MRVALLTGGGDCPGLNAVIYAAVRKGINHYGDEFIGFLNGWIVVKTGIPSFLVTLGTFFMLQGLNLALTQTITNQVASPDIASLQGFGSAQTDYSPSVQLIGLQRGLLAVMMSDTVATRRLESSEKAPSGSGRALRMPELYTRHLQPPNGPWVNGGQALLEGSQDVLQQAAGGVFFIDELCTLSKGQQKHLAF